MRAELLRIVVIRDAQFLELLFFLRDEVVEPLDRPVFDLLGFLDQDGLEVLRQLVEGLGVDQGEAARHAESRPHDELGARLVELRRQQPVDRPAIAVDHALLERGIDLAEGKDHRRAAELLDQRVVCRGPPDLASLEPGLRIGQRLEHHVVPVVPGRRQRQQLEPVPLLVVVADVVEQTRVAQLLGIELERVHPDQQPVAAAVIGAVAEQEVEHASRNRVELLQRRHHLGPHLGEREIAGGGLLHLLFVLLDDPHGVDDRRPASENFQTRTGDRFGRGHREHASGRDERGGERNQHSSDRHGWFSPFGSLTSRTCTVPAVPRQGNDEWYGGKRKNINRAKVHPGRPMR